jgi:hypothetical protein
LWIQVWIVGHSDGLRRGGAITKFAGGRNDFSQVRALRNFVSPLAYFTIAAARHAFHNDVVVSYRLAW